MTSTHDALHIVVREFRGQSLYLRSYDPATIGFSWSAKRDKAARTSLGTALFRARQAAIHYEANCAAKAVDGSVVRPQEARKHDVPRKARTPNQIIAEKRRRGLAAMSPGRPMTTGRGAKWRKAVQS